jgi:hypothetical protein
MIIIEKRDEENYPVYALDTIKSGQVILRQHEFCAIGRYYEEECVRSDIGEWFSDYSDEDSIYSYGLTPNEILGNKLIMDEAVRLLQKYRNNSIDESNSSDLSGAISTAVSNMKSL